jgi:hypothetical protein
VRTFEANGFDAALRMAVDAGLLKAACVRSDPLLEAEPRGAGRSRGALRRDPTIPG